MSFVNHLPPDSFQGEIDGIVIEWRPNAIAALPENASALNKDQEALRKATEHVAYQCAKRLEKSTIRIKYAILRILTFQGYIQDETLTTCRGSFHNSTTIGSTGHTIADQCHCSIKLALGQLKVHIYTNLSPEVALGDMQVLGKGVVSSGKNQSDPDLFTGIWSP
ncbi:uncharacterized protein N7459_002301 [Penicillium hispanicum]|uniref:uncharacterized protein n=1 Tax=Penicillium hispanicum TaxID=1080232 RepID=UPI0025407093|nr:uncharacterized protein N7459_002301 [Penicillium hispanicum]KAJ5591932.1 hypothetical protein N7459_002301 [Penicillium hispanicum]